MTVDVIVPYAAGCEHRQRAWQWLRTKYETVGLNVIEGTGDPDRWCKADAVRDALNRSIAETIAICDADVWTDGLRASIDAVEAGASWSVPHWNVCRLSESGTDRYIRGVGEGVDCIERHVGMIGGGIVVIPRLAYEEVPLDSRFVGWGGEDQAWGLALRTVLGQPHHFRAPLIHLWHPPQARRSRHRGSFENQMLVARYADCEADPQAMRAMIGEGRCQSIGSSPPP